MTQHGDWLRSLASAGKGGAELPPIDRGLPYELVLNVPIDVSADSFSASLRVSPDASGSTLADFTVDVGSWDGTITPLTLSLTDTEVNALPSDTDADGQVELVMDILRDPTGDAVKYRFLGGNIYVNGKVTDA